MEKEQHIIYIIFKG